ncbi:MAG TPA: hypothetical protein VGW33_03735 [Terriglobia bacterium]|nr:hypothetical protein [Terriglobia bacterium]
MASRLLQLAQDLDWLGCQLGQYGPKVADGGVPGVSLAAHGASLAGGGVSEKQRGLLSTADKIQRELLNSVRFDPTRLVGVGAPVADTLDSVAEMLAAVEDIKEAALGSALELPPKVRTLASMVRNYLDTIPTAA